MFSYISIIHFEIGIALKATFLFRMKACTNANLSNTFLCQSHSNVHISRNRKLLNQTVIVDATVSVQ